MQGFADFLNLCDKMFTLVSSVSEKASTGLTPLRAVSHSRAIILSQRGVVKLKTGKRCETSEGRKCHKYNRKQLNSI